MNLGVFGRETPLLEAVAMCREEVQRLGKRLVGQGGGVRRGRGRGLLEGDGVGGCWGSGGATDGGARGGGMGEVGWGLGERGVWEGRGGVGGGVLEEVICEWFGKVGLDDNAEDSLLSRAVLEDWPRGGWGWRGTRVRVGWELGWGGSWDGVGGE